MYKMFAYHGNDFCIYSLKREVVYAQNTPRFLSDILFSGHFGPDRLFVFLFLALRSPTVYQPELHQQLAKIEPIGLTGRME